MHCNRSASRLSTLCSVHSPAGGNSCPVLSCVVPLTCGSDHQRSRGTWHTRPRVWTKVVIRLPVNWLPVKLPVTGFNFQLPVTDLPTLSSRNAIFGFSFVSHTRTGEQRQVYIGPRHTGAMRRLGPVGSALPSISLSSLLLYPSRIGSP